MTAHTKSRKSTSTRPSQFAKPAQSHPAMCLPKPHECRPTTPAPRAQKTEQPNRHIKVHEELAPPLVGAYRQIAKQPQRQPKPCGNQRRRMHAACAEIAHQTKSHQNAANTRVTFATRDLHLYAWQGYQSRHTTPGRQVSLHLMTPAELGLYFFTFECAPIHPWQTPSPAPASPSSCHRDKSSAAPREPSPA